MEHGHDATGQVASPVVPESVEIMGTPWRVVQSEPWGDTGMVGECDWARREIRLQSSMCDSLKIEVFFHELLHAMMAAVGLAQTLDTDTEERVCYALAPIMLDTFRVNGFRFDGGDS